MECLLAVGPRFINLRIMAFIEIEIVYLGMAAACTKPWDDDFGRYVYRPIVFPKLGLLFRGFGCAAYRQVGVLLFKCLSRKKRYLSSHEVHPPPYITQCTP